MLTAENTAGGSDGGSHWRPIKPQTGLGTPGRPCSAHHDDLPPKPQLVKCRKTPLFSHCSVRRRTRSLCPPLHRHGRGCRRRVLPPTRVPDLHARLRRPPTPHLPRLKSSIDSRWYVSLARLVPPNESRTLSATSSETANASTLFAAGAPGEPRTCGSSLTVLYIPPAMRGKPET